MGLPCIFLSSIFLFLCGDKFGENYSGELHRETADPRANRITAEELARLGCQASESGQSPAQRPCQAGQRCPAAERNDPADQVDCGEGAN